VILLAAGIVYPVVKYFRLLNSSAYKLFIHFGNGIGHCINAVLYVLAARRIDLSVVPNPNACCSCPGIRACCAKSLGFLLVIWALVQLAIAITIMCIDLDKAVKEGDEVSTAED
jgi:hypothetical protein